MFASVLVANRGEIAVRVFRTLRRMGIAAIAVSADADADARHVREADRAVRLAAGGAPGAAGAGAAAAYLDVAAVVDAAVRSGADAVHPGYGFLSENAALPRALGAAGVAWVGPPAEAIEAMGDKIRAKETVAGAGVPVVPGGGVAGMGDAELAAVADSIGYPVLIKPSAGGGGKGMHRVETPAVLAAALATARREARAAFGDDTLLVERWVSRPRHLEIQVLADGHGTVLHLGERECSLQRRHQKVVEEAPSPLLAADPDLRLRMGEAAAAAARSVGYRGAGTVEFVVPGDDPGTFYFMEMNTRLQVEHPVTEAVTGVDLVEWQLRVAAGEPLAFGQGDVAWSGHAVEARVYAEDPARGFVPTGGPVLAWHPPGGAGIRVDDGIAAGDQVTPDFDPMLAKVVAWAPSRPEALRRLDLALADTVVLGLGTNVGFLRRLISHPAVQRGELDTGLIEREAHRLARGPVPAEEALVAAAVLRWQQAWARASPGDPWSAPTGWRAGGAALLRWRMRPAGGDPVEVRLRPPDRAAAGGPVGAEVEVAAGQIGVAAGGTVVAGTARGDLHDDRLALWWNGTRRLYHWAEGGGFLWLAAGGEAWAFEELGLSATVKSAAAAAGGGAVRSPMPGTVRTVLVAAGDEVAAGQEVAAVEAMKMEYSVAAGAAGRVSVVRVREGQRVALDEILVEIEVAASA